ncbi:FCD domain-containing protein [Bradyrhizobium sp. dw_411]|uniref:GntR family transcriptional regulator n=1 Tax=Bradyrhizobium sp. dw_411 TaxID=2720082 RepID=UPI001BCDBF3A|nr:FCD domain-containing protein [Bradyrhizobium sp. dw_411]
MIKAAQPDDTRSLTESTYRLIRSDILSGSIQPENKMQIIDLSQRHGTSASAVREALSRLVSESLVTLEVQKGFRAAPMSVREFQEITDLRIMLEMQAIRSAIMLGGEDWEAEIVAAYYRLELAEKRVARQEIEAAIDWEARNRDFHDALVGACDSQWLMRLRALLYDHSTRYRSYSLSTGAMRRDSSLEHQLLRTAVLARNTDEACALIKKHFQATLDTYRSSVELS